MSGQFDGLSPYPFDFSLMRKGSRGKNIQGRTAPEHQASLANEVFVGQLVHSHQATSIAQKALRAWNIALRTGQEKHQAAFLACARWLLEHVEPAAQGGAGWPILTQLPTLSEPLPRLSAA